MTATTPARDRVPHGADRLPRAELSRGARTGELLRGTAATGVLLAVLAGVPFLLLAAVGNPVPTGAPRWSWLDAELSTGALLDVLAVVLWVLWGHFAVCVVAEVRAWATGAPATRSALGGPGQLLARRLVAAVLLLTAGGVPLAAPATATPGPGPVAASTASPDPGWADTAATGATAGHEAGPARPVEPATDPATAPATDPATAPDPSWTAPPAPAGGPEAGLVAYVVQPPSGRHHDCLWDIAERTLGDPLRYREVFELNRDRVQADGSRLVDADLVRPGWTLLLPADAVGVGAGDGVRTAADPG